jgi:hypothetical protein
VLSVNIIVRTAPSRRTGSAPRTWRARDNEGIILARAEGGGIDDAATGRGRRRIGGRPLGGRLGLARGSPARPAVAYRARLPVGTLRRPRLHPVRGGPLRARPRTGHRRPRCLTGAAAQPGCEDHRRHRSRRRRGGAVAGGTPRCRRRDRVPGPRPDHGRAAGLGQPLPGDACLQPGGRGPGHHGQPARSQWPRRGRRGRCRDQHGGDAIRVPRGRSTALRAGRRTRLASPRPQTPGASTARWGSRPPLRGSGNGPARRRPCAPRSTITPT